MDFERYLRRYKQSIYRAARDDFLRLALSRGFSSARNNKRRAFALFPEIPEKVKRLKEVKEYAITYLDEMAKEAMERFEMNDGNAHYARTTKEALEIFGKIVGSGKTVVKAKSITSEELSLNEYLEGMGNKVYETDLGSIHRPAYG